jgi:hypothetical protein
MNKLSFELGKTASFYRETIVWVLPETLSNSGYPTEWVRQRQNLQ